MSWAAPPTDEAAVWLRAGDIREPENRAAVVRELREINQAHRRRAIEQAHRLNLPGRVNNMDGATADSHATHVGGTIAASGVNTSARGMAVAATIDSYDWNDDGSEMSARGASYGGEPGKIALSNHSYGMLSGWNKTGSSSPAWEWWGTTGTTAADCDEEFGKYNWYSRDVDTRAYNLPYYLIFWAAGNDRSDNPPTGAQVALDPANPSAMVAYDPTLHPAGDGKYRGGYENIGFCAVAKNVVTIGAVNDAVTSGVRDPAKATITTFSSWGPTDDGRIKPDLVANGYGLYSSTASGDATYATWNGTSMASPNATGTAVLLLDLHGRLFPGQHMRASTLKGLLIHTADDLGRPGPDYCYGWGLINSVAAAELLTAMQTSPAVPRMIEQQLTTLVTTRTHAFTWDGVSPIRVTLCSARSAGAMTTAADNRTPRLVNDLNLRVTGPSGSVHLPWVMPFVGTWTTESMSAPATTGTGSPGWMLTTNQSHSPSNAYFCPGPAQKVTDNLVSEPFVLTATVQQLRLHFWHTYDTEIYDGGLLEVSPDNGTNWYEIGAAGSGASFVRGGYTTTITKRFFTPASKAAELHGRPAWSVSGGSQFTEVVVALDTAVYSGTALRARWRLSTDYLTASPGWYVDSVRLTGYDTANDPPPAKGTIFMVE